MLLWWNNHTIACTNANRRKMGHKLYLKTTRYNLHTFQSHTAFFQLAYTQQMCVYFYTRHSLYLFFFHLFGTEVALLCENDLFCAVLQADVPLHVCIVAVIQRPGIEPGTSAVLKPRHNQLDHLCIVLWAMLWFMKKHSVARTLLFKVENVLYFTKNVSHQEPLCNMKFAVIQLPDTWYNLWWVHTLPAEQSPSGLLLSEVPTSFMCNFQKRTTPGIPMWSPTIVLTRPDNA